MINFVEEAILLDNYFFPIIDNKRKYKSKKWVDIPDNIINKYKCDENNTNDIEVEKLNIKTSIEEVINSNEIEFISVPGYKGKFVIQNNIATLFLRGYKRVFTEFTKNELNEIIILLEYSFKNDKLNHKVSASRFLYYLKVWRETEKNAIHIENIGIRGLNYHIDHIIPINFCYANNICHIKAGSTKNLQMLSRQDNLNKNKKVNVAELHRVY